MTDGLPPAPVIKADVKGVPVYADASVGAKDPNVTKFEAVDHDLGKAASTDCLIARCSECYSTLHLQPDGLGHRSLHAGTFPCLHPTRQTFELTKRSCV